MKNAELASLFDKLADILEIKGENEFKVRAYRKAAMVLRGLGEPVEDFYSKGKLMELPGIGEGIAKKIAEYLETGKITKLEEESKDFPESLLEMLKIPGLGAKTVGLLYRRLGIKTVDELERAAKSGKLLVLPGMGSRKIEKILEGIEKYRTLLSGNAEKRFLLGDVYMMILELTDFLKEKAPMERITPAGSFRRMKPTVGDIDILVSTNSPGEVMEAFKSHPEVKEILWSGESKTSVLFGESMIQIDLRAVNPESWGAALQYFTGSKNHNIHLREIAKKMGFKINEYGVFVEATGERIAGKTEESVYRALGLQFIPPEMREDWGEIELAQNHSIPELIRYDQIKGDLHIHTRYSDGSNTIEQIVLKALEMGYSYIAITDHSQSLRVARGLEEERLRQQWKEIEELQYRYPQIKILKGSEVDILPDGSLDYPDDVLRELDFVVASVHTKFNMSEDEMTQRIIRAMENKYVTAIGHPTGRLLFKRDPYPLNVEEFLKVAAETGTFVEINSNPERLDLEDRYIHIGKRYGVGFVISTDSHNIHQMWSIKLGVGMARRGWLTADEILNTHDLEDLTKLIYRKR